LSGNQPAYARHFLMTIFQYFNKATGLLALALVSLTIAFSMPPEASGDDTQELPRGWARDWSNTDFSRTSIRLGEIRSGGVPRDRIPAINEPAYTHVSLITKITDTEPVISVFLGGEKRAYPLRILMWHEIVNDTLGGVPIAVTFCPLCNSAVVFERQVGGRVFDFGTTGKLRNSDLVMYDRQTESWWQQFVGEAIVGEMTGTTLKALPSRVESFSRFKSRAGNGPEVNVIVPKEERARNYGINPYSGYDSAPRPFLYTGAMPDNIAPLARVVAINGEAWALDLVRDNSPIKAGDLVISWEAGQNSALDSSRIDRGRDIGNVIVQRRTAAGELEDAVHDISFAFAFHAFFPQGTIHTTLVRD